MMLLLMIFLTKKTNLKVHLTIHKTCIALIDKSRIIEEVLKLYQDEELQRDYLLALWMIMQLGVAPNQKCFSEFWNAFLSQNGNGYSHFTFCAHPNFSLQRYPILGRVITHEPMPLLAMQPKSKMCFKILVLPKSYNTFQNIKDNLDSYLRNQSEWDLED